ncbi:MAG: 2-oxoglutarate ferredoxin oxidoreductase subunit beta [Myxococcota bacterium]|jgi:2-oxoglutarate ferredoxin oxidoreductase subunit beta
MSVTNVDDPRGPIPTYKKADFTSDQDVRWCPGCGDYAILAAVQRLMPKLGGRKEDHVFISGIGCSSRFPYYMNTYGFHTIHGRAPAFASGLKAANPNLHVWIVTGDGDSLSIGGNHLIHVLRRNFNVTILLFNNRIYGLTKGQYSPTSELGKKTKSTPMGSLDHPFVPAAVALGAGATFLARTYDIDAKHLSSMLEAAYAHKGASLIEIYQNCNIFNDKAFDAVTNKKQKGAAQLRLEPGEPMLFDEGTKGIIFGDKGPEVVNVGDGGVSVEDVAKHDPADANPGRAFALAHLNLPDFPVPMGILRQVQKSTYETMMADQVQEARKGRVADLKAMLHAGYTWTVE